MSIKEIMRNGALYADLGVEELEAERLWCRKLTYAYNNTPPEDEPARQEILKELLGSVGKDVFMEPPIRFAYGRNTHIGDFVYANFNLVVVDDVEVYIGSHVMFGPNVTISVTGHPVEPSLRRDGTQFSRPVRISDDVWIGAGVIILPGVTIGKGSVIGAGSVVTRDIPPGVVAVGSPCRVLRTVTDADQK